MGPIVGAREHASPRLRGLPVPATWTMCAAGFVLLSTPYILNGVTVSRDLCARIGYECIPGGVQLVGRAATVLITYTSLSVMPVILARAGHRRAYALPLVVFALGSVAGWRVPPLVLGSQPTYAHAGARIGGGAWIDPGAWARFPFLGMIITLTLAVLPAAVAARRARQRPVDPGSGRRKGGVRPGIAALATAFTVAAASFASARLDANTVVALPCLSIFSFGLVFGRGMKMWPWFYVFLPLLVSDWTAAGMFALSLGHPPWESGADLVAVAPVVVAGFAGLLWAEAVRSREHLEPARLQHRVA